MLARPHLPVARRVTFDLPGIDGDAALAVPALALDRLARFVPTRLGAIRVPRLTLAALPALPALPVRRRPAVVPARVLAVGGIVLAGVVGIILAAATMVRRHAVPAPLQRAWEKVRDRVSRRDQEVPVAEFGPPSLADVMPDPDAELVESGDPC